MGVLPVCPSFVCGDTVARLEQLRTERLALRDEQARLMAVLEAAESVRDLTTYDAALRELDSCMQRLRDIRAQLVDMQNEGTRA